MSLFLVAVGLALAIEGTLYAAIPGVMRSMMRRALELSDQVLRLTGVATLALGVVIVAVARLIGGGL